MRFRFVFDDGLLNRKFVQFGTKTNGDTKLECTDCTFLDFSDCTGNYFCAGYQCFLVNLLKIKGAIS